MVFQRLVAHSGEVVSLYERGKFSEGTRQGGAAGIGTGKLILEHTLTRMYLTLEISREEGRLRRGNLTRGGPFHGLLFATGLKGR